MKDDEQLACAENADDFRALALLSAMHGVASAFSHPALQSMPPRLVAGRHLARHRQQRGRPIDPPSCRQDQRRRF